MEIKGIVIIILFVGLFLINLTPSLAQSGCYDPNLTKERAEAKLAGIMFVFDDLTPGTIDHDQAVENISLLKQCIASFEEACTKAKFNSASSCYDQGLDIGKFDKSGGLDISKVKVPSFYPDNAHLQAEYQQCFMVMCDNSFNLGMKDGEKQRGEDELSARSAGSFLGITEEDVKEVVDEEEIAEIYEQNCVIATASYGSPMAKEVQMLREIRDNQLLQTQSGSAFMGGFNTVYYSFAPTVAQWEDENPVFKEIVKTTITPLITSLSLLNHVSMDSEAEVLGYGISIILLNLGMYFVAPAAVVWQVKKRI